MNRRITATRPAGWMGAFVEREFGVRVHTDPRGSIVPVDRLVGLALRRNPRRAHLLVSTVLAKHVPTDPATSIAAASLLGVLVVEALEQGRSSGLATSAESWSPSPVSTALGARLTEVLDAKAEPGALREEIARARVLDPALSVVGYAETATGLGRLVADTLGAAYIHSTRHEVAGAVAFAGFEEEHSHATSHRLLPREAGWFTRGGTIVLVDDELSTGTTIVNTIRSLHAVVPQSRWIVAALIDLRGSTDRSRFDALALEVGAPIDVVSLGTGSVELPEGLLDEARRFVADRASTGGGAADADPESTRGPVSFLDLTSLPALASDRTGTLAAERPDLLTGEGVPDQVASAVEATLSADSGSAGAGTVLVLGSEEFIAFPLAVADRLRMKTSAEVTFSTTTRSPIAAFDHADYAIRTAIRFQKHDPTVDDEPDRYAYNLTRGGVRFDHIVLMPEPGTPTGPLLGPGSVTEALAGVAGRVTVILLAAPATPLEKIRA